MLREEENPAISNALPQRFCLGDVLVDGSHNYLVHSDGREIRLEPRLIRLLTVLAQAGGEPVARTELLAEVSSLPYAGDEALTQAISRLRQALGDTPKAPTFIKTIPRKGYVLVMPVSLEGLETKHRSDTGSQIMGLTGPNSSQLLPLLMAGAILLLSGLVVWFVLFPREIVRETELILNSDQEFIEKKDQEFTEKEDKVGVP